MEKHKIIYGYDGNMYTNCVRFYSYIDGATGSYLFAAIASGGAGIWMYIKSKLTKKPSKNQTQPEENN